MPASLYNQSQDAMISYEFRETMNTRSYDVTPDMIPGLIAWFRAESDISQSIAFEGKRIFAVTESFYQTIFATQSFSSPTLAPWATFIPFKRHGALSFPYLPKSGYNINRTFQFSNTGSVFILFKGNGSDTMLMASSGINTQLRRFRAGTNTIGNYSAATSDLTSNTFSSSLTQSVVCGWVWDAGAITWWEGKYARGSNPTLTVNVDTIGYNVAGGSCSGSIAEICIWDQTLTQAQINDLYDGYWRQKYWYEPLYATDIITRSYSNDPPLTFGLGNTLTGYTNSTVCNVGGELNECPTMSKTVVISVINDWIKARKFVETGSILPPPPPWSGSNTYDPLSASYIQYASGSTLLGKNSGSNEWNNVTPACAYVARPNQADWQAYDNITTYSKPGLNWLTTSYVSGTRPDDNPSRGYLYWSSSLYPYVSHNNFVGMKVMDGPRLSSSLYPTNSLIISESNFTGGFQYGTGSGYGRTYGGFWSGSWQGRGNYTGIKGYESPTSSSYDINSFVNGLSGSTIWQWNAFASSSWTGSTQYTGIKAYENFSTTSYITSSLIDGSSSYASDPRYLAFGSSSWIGRTL